MTTDSPQSLDAERSVLAAMMLDAEAAKQAAGLLSPTDFYSAANSRIFGAVVRLASSGTPADMVTLSDSLADAGDLEVVGGTVYLAGLLEAATTAANWKHHAKLVKASAKARALRAGAIALAQGLDARGEPEAIQEAVRRLAGLAKPQEAERGPSHVSVKLAELFTTSPLSPLPTGLDALDTLDILPGHLCVIGARPSVGKTIMLGTLAENAASRGWDCLFLSIEMPRREIQQRMVASIGSIPLDAVKKQSDPAMVAAAGKLADLPLWVEDGNDEPPITLDVEGICALVRMFSAVDNGGRPRAVFVDYLQLVRSRRRFDKKFDLVGNTCVELKRLAKDCGVVVVAAAQLSRLVEQRGKESIPILSDLADSSEIEKSADQIIFIHRKMMETEGEERNKTLLVIAKNRHGPTWRPLVRMVGQYCRFEDITGGWQ